MLPPALYEVDMLGFFIGLVVGYAVWHLVDLINSINPNDDYFCE
jgi:hypothetical protein